MFHWYAQNTCTWDALLSFVLLPWGDLLPTLLVDTCVDGLPLEDGLLVELCVGGIDGWKIRRDSAKFAKNCNWAYVYISLFGSYLAKSLTNC